jgi:hypothetical protein
MKVFLDHDVLSSVKKETKTQAILLKSKLLSLQMIMNYFESIKECRENGFKVFAFLFYYRLIYNAVAGKNKNQCSGTLCI